MIKKIPSPSSEVFYGSIFRALFWLLNVGVANGEVSFIVFYGNWNSWTVIFSSSHIGLSALSNHKHSEQVAEQCNTTVLAEVNIFFSTS